MLPLLSVDAVCGPHLIESSVSNGVSDVEPRLPSRHRVLPSNDDDDITVNETVIT